MNFVAFLSIFLEKKHQKVSDFKVMVLFLRRLVTI